MSRFHDILDSLNKAINTKKLFNSEDEDEDDMDDSPEELLKEKLETELELEMIKKKLNELRKSKGEDGDFVNIEDMEVETIEHEMMEYKKDFYDMSVGSLRAIATHAQKILDSLDNTQVNENLTESWLQGKIAITEDYMRTIHDFVMFVAEAVDNNKEVGQSKRPGLWENIRKKKEREGKNYKPAKPGDPDRPNPDQWKKLTK